MFTAYQQKAGITRHPFDGKSFHALRRRIATKMVTSGVPITTISQVLGQVNTESTKQYLSFHSEQLRECALSLDGIAWKEDMFNV
jgi:site-specific recombinase XerD